MLPSIPRVWSIVLSNLAYFAWVARDYTGARQHFERVLQLCERQGGDRAGLSWIHSLTLYNLGLVEIQEGSYLQARKQLMRAWQQTRELGHNQLVCASLNALSLVALLEGKADDALHYAQVCRNSVMEFGDIEASLSDYYLALGYLAAGRLTEADQAWLGKPQLPVNHDTCVEYDRLGLVLDRLAQPDYQPGAPPTPEVLQRVTQWQQELRRTLATAQ